MSQVGRPGRYVADTRDDQTVEYPFQELIRKKSSRKKVQ